MKDFIALTVYVIACKMLELTVISNLKVAQQRRC